MKHSTYVSKRASKSASNENTVAFKLKMGDLTLTGLKKKREYFRPLASCTEARNNLRVA